MCRHAWAQAAATGAVTAVTESDRVVIRNETQVSVDVPLTGIAAGDPYAGGRSGWVTITPGVGLGLEHRQRPASISGSELVNDRGYVTAHGDL